MKKMKIVWRKSLSFRECEGCRAIDLSGKCRFHLVKYHMNSIKNYHPCPCWDCLLKVKCSERCYEHSQFHALCLARGNKKAAKQILKNLRVVRNNIS